MELYFSLWIFILWRTVVVETLCGGEARGASEYIIQRGESVLPREPCLPINELDIRLVLATECHCAHTSPGLGKSTWVGLYRCMLTKLGIHLD